MTYPNASLAIILKEDKDYDLKSTFLSNCNSNSDIYT